MISKRFARELAGLGSLGEVSPEIALDRLTALAVRGVDGCAGAAAVIWQDGEMALLAASHPEAGMLLECQHARREGPAWLAVRDGRPEVVEDMAADRRWWPFAALALRHGIRSSISVAASAEGTVLSLDLYSARSRGFDQASAEPVAELLAGHMAVIHRNHIRYEQASRQVSQMRQALDSRAVINQATGIIMHSHGCDAATAFDSLRRVSQRSQTKLADVARRLIAEQGGSLGQAPQKVDLSPG